MKIEMTSFSAMKASVRSQKMMMAKIASDRTASSNLRKRSAATDKIQPLSQLMGKTHAENFKYNKILSNFGPEN